MRANVMERATIRDRMLLVVTCVRKHKSGSLASIQGSDVNGAC